jgi:hypothetical protein
MAFRLGSEVAAELRERAQTLRRAAAGGSPIPTMVGVTPELLEEAAGHLAAFGSRPQHHDGCESEGVYRKFHVSRTDGADQPGGKHDGCWYFVLDPTHDVPARTVLGIYAELARAEGREPLADDLWERPELSARLTPVEEHRLAVAVSRMLGRVGWAGS